MADNQNSPIVVTDLQGGYNGQAVIHGCNMEIASGEIVVIMGGSGSGKSTVARAFEQRLVAQGKVAYALDGDNLRLGLNTNLTFSADDRKENIRRVGELAGAGVPGHGLGLLEDGLATEQLKKNVVKQNADKTFKK